MIDRQTSEIEADDQTKKIDKVQKNVREIGQEDEEKWDYSKLYYLGLLN